MKFVFKMMKSLCKYSLLFRYLSIGPLNGVVLNSGQSVWDL
jgi:hypothetical protein